MLSWMKIYVRCRGVWVAHRGLVLLFITESVELAYCTEGAVDPNDFFVVLLDTHNNKQLLVVELIFQHSQEPC